MNDPHPQRIDYTKYHARATVYVRDVLLLLSSSSSSSSPRPRPLPPQPPPPRSRPTPPPLLLFTQRGHGRTAPPPTGRVVGAHSSTFTGVKRHTHTQEPILPLTRERRRNPPSISTSYSSPIPSTALALRLPIVIK